MHPPEEPSRLHVAWRRATAPLRRMWTSDDPLDDYALVHMASAAGDALVAIALADSVFFSLPVGEARVRVALYLALTMAPLAVAGPVLVPLLDRGRFRRAISFAAGAGRALAAVLAAPRLSSLLLFPITFAILVLSKAHTITKNGLVAAYAPPDDGLMAANARLGRVAAAGVMAALLPGVAMLQLADAGGVLYLASAAYAISALLNLQLEQRELPRTGGADPLPGGRLVELGPAAAGSAGLRAAQGFLIFLLAFSLRRPGQPAVWFPVLLFASVLGGFVGDVVAPRLSRRFREEAVVLGSLLGSGVAAFLTWRAFSLGTLALFAGLTGMATEFGRLGFQSLMQRTAPRGAHGRVFVRYEVAFQLAWIGGAFVPAMIAIPFRAGVLLLAAFDVLLGLTYLFRPRLVRPDAA